jgi:gas vesicle protein
MFGKKEKKLFHKSHHGLIAGMILGAMFALLYAPQKGKFVRERMKKAYDEGDNAVYPLRKGFISLLGEFVRNAKASIKEKKEKNPFTITNIRHYV